MKAYVLITAKVGKSRELQEELRKDGLTQVEVVAGVYDLVAVVDAEQAEEIGRWVLEVIQRKDGVLSTVTLTSLG